MKIRIFVLFFVILVSFFTYSQDFDTPETVMGFFVNNMKTGNLDNVFLTSPFSHDTIVQMMNPRELINYMNAVLFQLDPNMPLQYYSITKYSLLGKYSIGLKTFVFNLLLSEQYPDFAFNLAPINNINESELDKYLSLLDTKNLQTLELIRMDIYSPDIQFSKRGKDNALRQYIKPYGCDEKIEYTILYRHNGKYYDGAATFIRYGTNWYIESLGGVYSSVRIGCLTQVSGIIEYLNKYDIEEKTTAHSPKGWRVPKTARR